MRRCQSKRPPNFVSSGFNSYYGRRSFVGALVSATLAVPKVVAQPQATAMLAGFQPLPGKGSRLFVRLTSAPVFEVKVSARQLDYMLFDTEVSLRNNRNPLVLTHFDTPVDRAKLSPQGRHVVFRLHMKRQAEPRHEIVRLGDAAFSLRIDFV